MGKEFYHSYPLVREKFEIASDLLGKDYASLIFNGREEELASTEESQPSIFLVTSAILDCLESQFPQIKPLASAGLSLGEYSALYASGRISFEDGLRLVALRGKYMQQACLDHSSEMFVVVGLDLKLVEEALSEGVWIANLNCPGQIVVGGLSSLMEEFKDRLRAQGAKRLIPLGLSGAFHTPLMASAQRSFEQEILPLSLEESAIKIAMNVPGDFVADSELIKKYLIAQITHPVYWEKSIRALDSFGIDIYVEIGPGKTLQGMNKRIKVQGSTLNIEKASDLEQLVALS